SDNPGDLLVVTDVKFDKDKIIFDLNGGPDKKHRFLQHVQIGVGMGDTTPVVADNGGPVGSRLTLTFKDHIPELTGTQVKALLAPLISFDVKTPVQAFTDTLPPKLKDAILNHRVMVGMSTDMVLFALGRPDQKIRSIEDQMPYEEWIYGKPPEPVQFVRINGNRVIRLEIAAVGKTPQIWDKDEVDAMMRADGTPVVPPANTRTVAMGDVVRDPNTQAPAAPPTLRKDGEALPQDDPRSLSAGAMKPVQFPKQQADDYPDASKLPRTAATDETATDKPVEKTADKAADKDSAKPSGGSSPATPPVPPAGPPSQ